MPEIFCNKGSDLYDCCDKDSGKNQCASCHVSPMVLFYVEYFHELLIIGRFGSDVLSVEYVGLIGVDGVSGFGIFGVLGYGVDGVGIYGCGRVIAGDDSEGNGVHCHLLKGELVQALVFAV